MRDLVPFHGGDAAHWEELVRQHGPLVLGITTRFARDRDEAEDWFQEAWARAFRKRRAWKGDGSFRAWLIVLTRRVCLGRLKSERRLVEVREALKLEPMDHPLDPLEALEDSDRARTLRAAIARLPHRQREALSLRLNEDHATSGIAKIMGVSEATVRSLISKGIARLSEDMRIV